MMVVIVILVSIINNYQLLYIITVFTCIVASATADSNISHTKPSAATVFKTSADTNASPLSCANASASTS